MKDWNLRKKQIDKRKKSPQVICVACFSCPRTLLFTFDTLVVARISEIPKLKCYFTEKVWEICQNCHSCQKFWLDSVSIFWLKWCVETKKILTLDLLMFSLSIKPTGRKLWFREMYLRHSSSQAIPEDSVVLHWCRSFQKTLVLLLT